MAQLQKSPSRKRGTPNGLINGLFDLVGSMGVQWWRLYGQTGRGASPALRTDPANLPTTVGNRQGQVSANAMKRSSLHDSEVVQRHGQRSL
jgi:hypothetical protein